MPRFAIFGSCVSRDAFELDPAHAQGLCVELYLSRTTVNSALASPLALPPLTESGKLRFEDRCVMDDLYKRHFDKLNQSQADYLIIDLIDERNPLLYFGGSALCLSVPFAKFAANHGWPVEKNRRLHSTDPENVAATLANLPLFAARILGCFSASRLVIHRALWASRFRKPNGEVALFGDQAVIDHTNAVLRRYYDQLIAALPGCAVIEVAATDLLADEAHRWTLEPYHYAPPYYAAFLSQLVAITA